MSKDVVMYTSKLCGYCRAAKKLLDGKGVEYRIIPVDFDSGKRQEMMDKSGRRTVPQIFIDEHHVGGFDDLHAIDTNGELDKLLSAD